MWIATTIGFFSIVQKQWDKADNTLTVRARVKADLEAFIDVMKKHSVSAPRHVEILEDANADYRYRIQAPRNAVETAIWRISMDITYDNFKNEVSRVQGRDRARIYGNVWSELLALQAYDGFVFKKLEVQP